MICHNQRSAESGNHIIHWCKQTEITDELQQDHKVMGFRKGGHHSTRKRWYYGTERLKVVNTYRALSKTDLFNTPQLQGCYRRWTLNACKTRYYRNSEDSEKLNCFSLGLFFRYFDAQIVLPCCMVLSFGALSGMVLWKKCTCKLADSHHTLQTTWSLVIWEDFCYL